MVKSTQSLEDLSAEEQSAVTQLRNRMVGYMDPKLFEDVNVFVRFLRARDLNLNAAEAMLRKHIEWRKIHQIDDIANYAPSEVLKKYITFNCIGLDLEGSPILYFNIGHIDSRGLLKSARKIDCIKYIVQKLEKSILAMHNESIQRGKHIDKWTIVINFEGLSFAVASHKETLDLVGNIIVMYEANYPERLKVAYCINASIYFTMAFGVVKHFLSAPTYRKINIFGRDGWREEILKLIHPDIWPAFLGGNRTDPDGNPLCKTFVTHGGTIPESYYINKKKSTLMNAPGFRKLTVSRMSKTQLTLNVTEVGSHIEWEFETKSRDIAFCLLYRKNPIDSRVKELIPKQRVETNVAAEAGMFKCENPGIYIIEFDNSYSWIFQKEIYYRVGVVKNSIIIEHPN